MRGPGCTRFDLESPTSPKYASIHCVYLRVTTTPCAHDSRTRGSSLSSSTRAALRFASQTSRFFGGVTRTKNMTVGMAEECPGGSRECGVGHSIAGENLKVGKEED